MQRNAGENGREGGARIVEYIHLLRVASDVDGGLEEPKCSANHVMACDAVETVENVCDHHSHTETEFDS